jgi:hypothetical protein
MVKFGEQWGAAGTMYAAVYSDNAGAVGTRLFSGSASYTSTYGGTLEVPVSGSSLSNGTTYWICCYAQKASGSMNIQYSTKSATQSVLTWTEASAGSWTDNPTTSTFTSSKEVVLYATDGGTSVSPNNVSASSSTTATEFISASVSARNVVLSESESTTETVPIYVSRRNVSLSDSETIVDVPTVNVYRLFISLSDSTAATEEIIGTITNIYINVSDSTTAEELLTMTKPYLSVYAYEYQSHDSTLDQYQEYAAFQTSFGGNVYSNIAETFMPSVDGQLSSIKFQMSVGKPVPTDDLVCYIYSNGGEDPYIEPETLLQTSINVVNGSWLATNTENELVEVEFFFNDGPTLLIDTVYWAIIERSNPNEDDGGYGIGYFDYYEEYSGRGLAYIEIADVWYMITESYPTLYFYEYYKNPFLDINRSPNIHVFDQAPVPDGGDNNRSYGLSFEGNTGDYKITPSDQSVLKIGTTSNITVGAWIYLRKKDNDVYGTDNHTIAFMAFNNGSNNGYLFQIGASTGRFVFYYGNQLKQSGTDYIPYNRWVHVAFKISGSEVKGYVNGVNTYTDTIARVSDSGSDYAIIGEEYSSFRTSFLYMDEFFSVKSALSDSQILAIATSGTYPTVDILYYLNEGSGTTATDFSGNSNDGTIVGCNYVNASRSILIKENPLAGNIAEQEIIIESITVLKSVFSLQTFDSTTSTESISIQRRQLNASVPDSTSLTESITVSKYGNARYWVGNGGSWNETSHWAGTSGGVSGLSVPTADDNVYFDANSFSTGSQTITLTTGATCKSIDFTGVDNSPLLTGTQTLTIYGSVTLSDGMSLSSSQITIVLANTEEVNITTAGNIFPNTTISGSGEVNLVDDFQYYSSFTISSGTFTTNDIPITQYLINSSFTATETPTINLGGSEIVLNSYSSWNIGSNVTLNAGTSSIICENIDGEFHGGGKTYNDVEIYANGITFYDSNTFNSFTLTTSAATSFYVEAGTIQTCTTFIGNGSVGTILHLESDSPGDKFTISSTSASVSYIDVTDCIASGAGIPFDARVGGVNGGNNENWLFYGSIYLTTDSTTVTEIITIRSYINIVTFDSSIITENISLFETKLFIFTYDSVYISESITAAPLGLFIYIEDVNIRTCDSYESSNYTENYVINGAEDYDGAVGQSFTGNGSIINSVQFYLAIQGSPTGNVLVKIYAHSGIFGTSSVPTGNVLSTSDGINISTIEETNQLITFKFIGVNKILLENGTKYVVVVEYTNTAFDDYDNYLMLGIDSSSLTHEGNLCTFLNSSQEWSPQNLDGIFYVFTEGVVDVATAFQPYLGIVVQDPCTVTESISVGENLYNLSIFDFSTITELISVLEPQLFIYTHDESSVTESLVVLIQILKIDTSDSTTATESISAYEPGNYAVISEQESITDVVVVSVGSINIIKSESCVITDTCQIARFGQTISINLGQGIYII